MFFGIFLMLGIDFGECFGFVNAVCLFFFCFIVLLNVLNDFLFRELNIGFVFLVLFFIFGLMGKCLYGFI